MLLVPVFQSAANAGIDSSFEADIRILLNSFQQALNVSDVNKVAPFYEDEAIFIPSK